MEIHLHLFGEKALGGTTMENIPFPHASAAEKNILDISSMKQKYPGAAIEERDNRAKKTEQRKTCRWERSGMGKTEDWTPPASKKRKNATYDYPWMETPKKK